MEILGLYAETEQRNHRENVDKKMWIKMKELVDK